jgi:tRNA (Thr-GGU) A37 N-methylase
MIISFNPIGLIHSHFKDLADMPIQPTSESSAAGRVEIYPAFVSGLKDMEKQHLFNKSGW